MKFTKSYLWVIFLVVFTSAFSQSYTIHWGPVHKIGGRDYIEGIIKSDSLGFFVLRSYYNALSDRFTFLDYYSMETMNRSFSSALVYPESNKEVNIPFRLYFEDLYRVGTKSVLFMTSYNHEKDRHSAFAQILNMNGKPEGPVIELAKIKAERKSNRGKFHFTTSPNRQYVLVYNHEPFDQYNDEKFGFTVVDTAFQPVWSNEYSLPYKSQNFIPEDYRIDNHGNAYMLSKVFFTKEQEREKMLKGSNYYYTILRFQPEDEKNQFQEYVIRLKDKHVVNASMRISPSNDLVVAGYYADDKNLNKITGLYYFTFPMGATAPSRISMHSLPEGFIPDFQTDVPSRFGEEGEPQLINTQFIFLEDGSQLLVTEHTLVTETCFTDFRTALTTCNYNYYFNDIFVIKIGVDETVKWKIKIPKRQLTRNDGGIYSSFSLGIIDGRLVILFNDHPKNLELKNDRGLLFMNDPKKATVVLVEIDAQGQVKKQALFSNDKRKTWFRPRIVHQPSSNTLLICTSRLRQMAFARIQVNAP
ncbi:MAG: hypothetical protein N2167_01865 [Flavobacteriales bacterium]|nr:hypothetical protein [Flavobacteriales bacterium]